MKDIPQAESRLRTFLFLAIIISNGTPDKIKVTEYKLGEVLYDINNSFLIA